MTQSDEVTVMKMEASRVEEDALHSAKGHFNAEERWQLVNLCMGIGTAVVAATSGVTAIADKPLVSGLLAFLAALIAGANTALSPEKRSADHGQSGRKYKALSNRARIFREIRTMQLDANEARAAFAEITGQRDDLIESSRGIPRWAYERAAKDISQGRSTYLIDKVKHDIERLSQ